VELQNSTVHRINARAEKKVTEAFVTELTKVRGKAGLLGKIAAASLGAPGSGVSFRRVEERVVVLRAALPG
jgi:hypothetical protein